MGSLTSLDHVASKQMQNIRIELRGKAVVVMGIWNVHLAFFWHTFYFFGPGHVPTGRKWPWDLRGLIFSPNRRFWTHFKPFLVFLIE